MDAVVAAAEFEALPCRADKFLLKRTNLTKLDVADLFAAGKVEVMGPAGARRTPSPDALVYPREDQMFIEGHPVGAEQNGDSAHKVELRTYALWKPSRMETMQDESTPMGKLVNRLRAELLPDQPCASDSAAHDGGTPQAAGGCGGEKATGSASTADTESAVGERHKHLPPLTHVGRLDKNTTGLLLLTEDTDLATALCLPGLCHKTYIATVRAPLDSPPSAEVLRRLVEGVELSDGPAQALEAEVCVSVRA